MARKQNVEDNEPEQEKANKDRNKNSRPAHRKRQQKQDAEIRHRDNADDPGQPLPQTQSAPTSWVEQWLAEQGMLDKDVDDTSWMQPVISVSELLHKLAKTPQSVTVHDLLAFSDITRQDGELVRNQWPQLPVDLRRQIVHALNEIAMEDLQYSLGGFLRLLLRDSDAEVRRSAIEGLWEEDEANLAGPLLHLMQHDEEPEVQAAAAEVLGNYVLAGELDELEPALAMRIEQALLETVEDKTQPLIVQCRALESLAYSSENGLRQLIEDAYYSQYDEMRISALRAMGRSADTHWRSLASAELQSPEPELRAEAAIACGELETKSAVPDLIDLLADEESIVRHSAILALGRIGGNSARQALRAIAANGEDDDAETAELALEELLFNQDIKDIDLFDEADEETEAALEDAFDQELSDDETDDEDGFDQDGWDEDPWGRQWRSGNQ